VRSVDGLTVTDGKTVALVFLNALVARFAGQVVLSDPCPLKTHRGLSLIRLAREEDAAAVSALVETAYSMYIPRLGRKSLPVFEDYMALISKGIVHVLEENGAIAGLVVLVPEDGAMMLNNIAVRPDAQGRGLGRALLNFAEAKARAEGYDTIRLYTNEVMSENLAIYEHCGYAVVHRREDVISTSLSSRRVYMAKQLR
jgi:GNAT superfamily N-acetyltransferase